MVYSATDEDLSWAVRHASRLVEQGHTIIGALLGISAQSGCPTTLIIRPIRDDDPRDIMAPEKLP